MPVLNVLCCVCRSLEIGLVPRWGTGVPRPATRVPRRETYVSWRGTLAYAQLCWSGLDWCYTSMGGAGMMVVAVSLARWWSLVRCVWACCICS